MLVLLCIILTSFNDIFNFIRCITSNEVMIMNAEF